MKSVKTQKEKSKRYYKKHRKECKERSKNYKQTEEGKKVHKKSNKKYYKTDSGKKSSQKYRQSDKGKRVRLKASLKFQYNFTLEEYDKLIEEQNGLCGICGGINSNGRRLYVDHDHKTGKVRGLLCNTCNMHLTWYEKFHAEARIYLDV